MSAKTVLAGTYIRQVRPLRGHTYADNAFVTRTQRGQTVFAGTFIKQVRPLKGHTYDESAFIIGTYNVQGWVLGHRFEAIGLMTGSKYQHLRSCGKVLIEGDPFACTNGHKQIIELITSRM